MGRISQGPWPQKVWFTCSPGLVQKYLMRLTPQQKEYVRKVGFGSFLSMADFAIDRDLTLWLLQRFNCDTESLEFESGISIPVRPLVKSILGIPSGPIRVEQHLYVDPDLYQRYYDNKHDGPNGYYIRKQDKSKSVYGAGPLIFTETEEKHFCIAFIMEILEIYLAPASKSFTAKTFFGAAQQVDKLSQMDWCNFTASYLFEGIKEFKQSDKRLVKVKGCVHILSVIFVDLLKFGVLIVHGGFPRIGIVSNRLNRSSVASCNHPSHYQLRRLEESVYASLLDKISKDNIIEGRKCADRDKNTDAGADQFDTTGKDTTRNSTKLMKTCHYSRATRSHKEVIARSSRATRSQQEPEDPLDHGRSILGASQKKHLVSAELGTATSSRNTLSLAVVEAPEDTSTPSAAPSSFAESASDEDSHTRHETLDISANADSTHHHSVEQEHINFPRDGQQLQSNGPSSEPYTAQIPEGMQVTPDISLGRNKASPSTMEEGGRSAKKARVEQSSSHVEPAGVGAVVDTNLLNCPLCSRPFKPPVFQCKGGHLACGTCIAKLPGIHCQKCEPGGAFDIPNMMMDTIVLSAKVKCSHDGCQSYVSYHELDDHHSMCPCAPCFCTERGCSFVGLPLSLLSHLTTQHSWPVHKIQYGKELRLQVPVSEPHHLLLGEEDDCVFLLVVEAVGQSMATAVSTVRLGTCMALQLRYMLNIVAYLPPVVASRRAHMLLLDMDVESSTRPGEVAVEELPSYLTVPPTYLVGAGASKEVSLDIRIDKIIS